VLHIAEIAGLKCNISENRIVYQYYSDFLVSLKLANLPIVWPKKNPKIIKKVLFRISGTWIFTNGATAIIDVINISNIPIINVVMDSRLCK
jgi:hypothetical protein